MDLPRSVTCLENRIDRGRSSYIAVNSVMAISRRLLYKMARAHCYHTAGLDSGKTRREVKACGCFSFLSCGGIKSHGLRPGELSYSTVRSRLSDGTVQNRLSNGTVEIRIESHGAEIPHVVAATVVLLQVAFRGLGELQVIFRSANYARTSARG